MTRLRRLTAALSGALLLQLTLLGSGAPCVMPGGASSDSMASVAGMDAMRHGGPSMGTASPASASASHGVSTSQGCDASGQSSDCQTPGSPGPCVSMTTCATAAVPVAQTVADVTVAVGAPALPEPASIASGPSAAPALPPPRA